MKIYLGLQLSGYLLSFFSIRVIAESFGLTHEIDFYWLLQGMLPLLCIIAYPYREYYIASYVYNDSRLKIYMALGELVKGIGGGLLFSLVLFYVIDALFLSNSMRAVAESHYYMVVTNIILFWLYEFISSVLVSLNYQLSYPIFKMMTVLSTLLSVKVFEGSIHHLLLFNNIAYLLFVLVALLLVIKSSTRINSKIVKRKSLFFQHLTGNVFLNISNFLFRNSLTNIGVGYLSAFQYAFSILSVGVTLIVVPVTNLVWPELIKRKMDMAFLSNFVCLISRNVLLLSLLSVIGFAISEPLVRLLFFGSEVSESLLKNINSAFDIIVWAFPYMFVINVGIRFFSVVNSRTEIALATVFYSLGLVIFTLYGLSEDHLLGPLAFLLGNYLGGLAYLSFLKKFIVGQSKNFWLGTVLSVLLMAGSFISVEYEGGWIIFMFVALISALTVFFGFRKFGFSPFKIG